MKYELMEKLLNDKYFNFFYLKKECLTININQFCNVGICPNHCNVI